MNKNDENIPSQIDGNEFLAESGFRFICELKEDAHTTGTPELLIKDWKVVEDWLGCANRPFNAEDKARIERAWKSYSGVGIAPSMSLQPAFDAYHRQARNERWEMVSVPSVVRDVFDRLLATDNEIAEKKQAEQRRLNQMIEERKSKTISANRFLNLNNQRRIWIVGLAIWSIYVIFRTSDYYEVFGVELGRWDSNSFWLNLLLPPVAIMVGMYVRSWVQRGNK